MSTTLESIKMAEKMTGKQLHQVESNKQNALKSGSMVHNYLEDDHRIYTAEIDNAIVDKDAVDAKERESQKAMQQKQALVQQK